MYQFIFFLMLLFLFQIALIKSEVIKIENKTHIHCIDDNINKDVALFVSSPLQKLAIFENFKDNLTWKFNDWDYINGSNLTIAPILDKRWEDIPLHKENYTRVHLFSSVSVSVHTPYDGLEILVYNYDITISHEHNEAVHKENNWYHYTILLKNGTVYLFENNKIVAQDNFVPTNVVFRNLNKQFYFKVHQDNKFWWSNKESEDKKASTIKIPPTGKSCLFLYTSLCKECYLEVIQNNTSKKTTITSINQESNLMESWQMQRLEINPNKEETLIIYRKKITDDSTGHWALDFRLCDSNNMAIYKKENESFNYICNILQINTTKKIKSSLSYEEKVCSPGKLGKNCDIKCKNVLNDNFPNCDRYMICKENADCNCAWGYGGQFCNNLCEEGKWGLSCKETCIDCTSCNKHTGKCKTNRNLLVAEVVVAVVLLVVVVV